MGNYLFAIIWGVYHQSTVSLYGGGAVTSRQKMSGIFCEPEDQEHPVYIGSMDLFDFIYLRLC